MTNFIITTTINAPNEAIRKYDAMEDWHLLVIGDRKTPEYPLRRGTFLDWKYQERTYPDLCELVGPDNTQRGRMIGLIEAHRREAEMVATIDDDCVPLPGWPGPVYVGRTNLPVDCFQMINSPAFDPHAVAGYKHPARGYPPQLRSRDGFLKVERTVSALLQQNFCIGEADYDACWRVHGVEYENCYYYTPFWSNAFSPVNTQNTIIHGSVLRDYCGELPGVGRVGDIWAGYIFQSIHPNSTIYAPATVTHGQDRTPASVISDLKDEIYSYEHALEFIHALKMGGPDAAYDLLPERTVKSVRAYRAYFNDTP